MWQFLNVRQMRLGQNVFWRERNPFVDWKWTPDTFPYGYIHFLRTPCFHPTRFPRPFLFPKAGSMRWLHMLMNMPNTLRNWKKKKKRNLTHNIIVTADRRKLSHTSCAPLPPHWRQSGGPRKQQIWWSVRYENFFFQFNFKRWYF